MKIFLFYHIYCSLTRFSYYLFLSKSEFVCRIMPRHPENSEIISVPFQKRMTRLLAEEDTESGPCTTAEFSKRAGIGKHVISNAVIYGILPSVPSLIKIADYTEKPLLYVLGRSDDETYTPAATRRTFGERLLLLLDERKLMIADVANAPGVTFARNSVHVWLKRGNLPSLEYLLQLAAYFSVSPDYLLGRTDYRN